MNTNRGGRYLQEPLGHPLDESTMDADSAALDLVESEQLQREAERMKGLGNKHMADQVRSFVV
jgi:hypothetical protein